MIKVGPIVVLLGILLLSCAAEARDFTVRKKTEDFTVDVAIDRNPPVLGNNAIRVEIRDSQGKYVADAKVAVNYYMPPMPGMPPMNYTVEARAKGNGYGAVMNFIMTGPWNIVIKVSSSGKRWSVTVPIDVR